MEDKIENNPLYKKIKEEIPVLEALLDTFAIIGLESEEFEKVKKKLPDFKKDFIEVSTSSDRFNKYFSPLGWISYESIEHNLMIKSIELAEIGEIDKAENLLIEYYESDKMDRLIKFTVYPEEFEIRSDLIMLAYEDYKAKRYHACIPVILMMIDGIVNDIDKNKGFWAEGTDVTVCDSIVGHSTGLNRLKEIFSETRIKTNTDVITIPYRHGILHGKDLGYANRNVAAKCWAALFAVRDWALIIKNGKKNPPKPQDVNENTMTFVELIDNINELTKNKEKIRRWKPRNIVIGLHIPINGNPDDYESNTPEQEVSKFFYFWKNEKYGKIASKIYYFTKESPSVNKEAGRIRKILKDKIFVNYYILGVNDKNFGTTHISVKIVFSQNNKEKSLECNFKLFYSNSILNVYEPGDIKGNWKYYDNILDSIDNIK